MSTSLPIQIRGYTIIELVVVMLVLSVLASVSFPIVEMKVQRDKEEELKRALWEIRDALDAYKRAADAGLVFKAAGASGYPPDLQSLVTGVDAIAANAQGKKLHFLRRIPRDPFGDPTRAPEEMWGLRSYESSADRPQPGGDVYDVYSLSSRTGLNGIPLRQW